MATESLTMCIDFNNNDYDVDVDVDDDGFSFPLVSFVSPSLLSFLSFQLSRLLKFIKLN